jgi:hypothetical protein
MILATMPISSAVFNYLISGGLPAGLTAVAILLYAGVAWAVIGNPKVFVRFLMPCSFLPLVIGLFGTSWWFYSGWLSLKDSDLNAGSRVACELTVHWGSVALPLIVGSFLTMLFIMISLVFQFIHRRTLAGLDDRP